MSEYTLSFKLPFLPPMGNKFYAGMHFRKRNRIKDEITMAVSMVVRDRRPPLPLDRYSLVCIRASSSEPDYDGLVGSFKIVIDALRNCGVLSDDKYSQTGPWEVSWQKEKPKKGWIRVQVSER